MFWILDEVFGANLRTAALEGHPWWKAAWYLACIAIGVAATLVPNRLPRLGLVEAGANIALLVAGVFVPYYRFIDVLASGGVPTEPPITMEVVVNFILAATIWVMALGAMRKD